VETRAWYLALERSQAVLDLAREHEFPVWSAVATCLHGAALAGLGQAEMGLAQIRQGIASYQELNTPPVFWTLLIFLEAEVCGLAGKPEQGLASLDRLSADFGADSDNLFIIEYYRLIADLLLAHSPNLHAEAEPLYLHALEIAQARGVLMFETAMIGEPVVGFKANEQGRTLLVEFIGNSAGFTAATVDRRQRPAGGDGLK
jgi:hypothetical protein